MLMTRRHSGDIRLLYNQFRTYGMFNFLVCTGVYDVVSNDSLSQEEKQEIISDVLKIMTVISNDILDATVPEYRYFIGEISSTEKNKMLSELKKVREFKTLASKFEYYEVFIQPAFTYMCDRALGGISKIDPKDFMKSLKQIRTFMKDVALTVAPRELLVAVQMKQAELENISNLEKAVTDANNQAYSEEVLKMKDELHSLHRQVKEIEGRITMSGSITLSKLRGIMSYEIGTVVDSVKSLQIKTDSMLEELATLTSQMETKLSSLSGGNNLTNLERIKEVVANIDRAIETLPESNIQALSLAASIESTIDSIVSKTNIQNAVDRNNIKSLETVVKKLAELRSMTSAISNSATEISVKVPNLLTEVNSLNGELETARNVLIQTSKSVNKQ